MKTAAFFCLPAMIILALGADFIAPHDPWKRFAPLLPPGPGHVLGTNDMGNDILSEFIHAGRVSMIVGFGAAALASSLGIALGLAAGMLRGPADELLMGAADVVLLVPRIPLVLTFAAFYRPSFWAILTILGLLWWPSSARVVRAKTHQIRGAGFILTDRTLGMSHLRIALTDILPNIAPVVLPQFLLTAASAMISEASLSFLGLGDPAVKSWGTMIGWAFARGGLINELWWWLFPPGIGIMITVFSLVALEFFLLRNRGEVSLDL